MKKQSRNLVTNSIYTIPESLDHKEEIDLFLEQNKGKKVIVVQGLGFVGAVMALIVANALTEEYAVIGIDLPSEASYWKIMSINEGVFPVVSSDKKIDAFYQNARKKGNLLATFDPYAYTKADVVVVDINLDVKKESEPVNNSLVGFDVDLGAFKKGIKSIGENCKEDVLVLVETTVPPGTCLHVVKPILDELFEQRGLAKKYALGHSYERVMPGPGYVDSIQNFYRVYSAINEESAIKTESFLRTIISTEEYPLTRLQSTTSTETAKVMENSFRAMNIAFIQEWTEFAEDAKINLHEVIAAIRMRPTHKNMMLPGLGVGGYCLTKDPLLASWASQKLFGSANLPQSERAVEINDLMPNHAYENIAKYLGSDLKGKKVLLLGLSYLSNVGDTRYTPVEILYNRLSAAGALLAVHDPYIAYWEEKGIDVNTDLSVAIAGDYDIVVFCTGHDVYRSDKELDEFLEKSTGKFIYDSNLILSAEQIRRFSIANQVKVVGRGDL